MTDVYMGGAMNKVILLTISLIAVSWSCIAENTIFYPDRAWKLGQNGYARVVYDISNDGKAVNVRVTDSEPKFLFDDSIKEQVYKWRFNKGEPKKDVVLNIKFVKPASDE